MKIVALLSMLWAVCSAHPGMWIKSSINTKNTCLVPIGYKLPPGGRMMMFEGPALDGKNGPSCNIVFKGNAITVKSDVTDGNIGFIVLVTEGSVEPDADASMSGRNGTTCAWGEGTGTATFKYTAPAKPSGKPILAGATCGTYGSAKMYSTYKIARTA